ncbi:MAG: hypothetical protein ACYSSI_09540 [Planctomycetota bacterium]|jgi:hypothetical protein
MKTKRLIIEVDAVLHRQVRMKAIKENKTMKAMVIELILERLRKDEKESHS